MENEFIRYPKTKMLKSLDSSSTTLFLLPVFLLFFTFLVQRKFYIFFLLFLLNFFMMLQYFNNQDIVLISEYFFIVLHYCFMDVICTRIAYFSSDLQDLYKTVFKWFRWHFLFHSIRIINSFLIQCDSCLIVFIPSQLF